MADQPSNSASVVLNMSATKLHLIIAGLWLSLFVSAMDTTIITTGLIKISSEFQALDQAAWLVTAYLLTYNSFLIITAKSSDIWGLKATILSFSAFFLVFSMACSAAQTMTQLIVFRALQGIGGSALYSLVFVAIVKLVDPSKIAFYSGVVSSVFALANLLGPVLGGVITDRTNWRWIFWMNGPIVGTAIALLLYAMPGLSNGKSSKERFRDFDVVGGALSVSWPIPLLFGLQEAGVHYEWDSAIIIGTMVTGVVLLAVFGLYETWATYRTKLDALFPVRLLENPTTVATLISMFLLGMPFYTMFIQLPQRFQSVNFTTAERAGILLLPVTLMTPVGAVVAGVMDRWIAAEYVLILATSTISIGIGLLSSLPVDAHISNATYAYEVVTGFGLGLASPPYFIFLYTSIHERDASVGTGSLNMVRTLGGAVAVAICTALHHSLLQTGLADFLSPEQISSVKESNGLVSSLPAESRLRLGRVFGSSYKKQLQVVLGLSLLNCVVAIIIAGIRKRAGTFGKRPVRTEENEFMKTAEKGGGGGGEQVVGAKGSSG
ncbi:unnamed protein product [Periconia digitata]|uniref:Major facilitator superfamily (MFS) profile domain-containing protein n=1 Tax=Periconia digitata TaxID=1303443 RepID=A0A9W4XWZ8_9PLEO|nr:unnamed protein product [Periconia digitata]